MMGIGPFDSLSMGSYQLPINTYDECIVPLQRELHVARAVKRNRRRGCPLRSNFKLVPIDPSLSGRLFQKRGPGYG